MRFFSAASMLGSLLGEPSPTSTTPGLPTARCTTSMFRLAATAGVTVQPPRMVCRIAAAAPGWPYGRVLSGLRVPAEHDHRAQEPAQHTQRQEHGEQAGGQPDDEEHDQHADAD